MKALGFTEIRWDSMVMSAARGERAGGTGAGAHARGAASSSPLNLYLCLCFVFAAGGPCSYARRARGDCSLLYFEAPSRMSAATTRDNVYYTVVPWRVPKQ